LNMMIFPWQNEDWQALQTMRAQLPHAILLHGQAGIGKRALAMAFGQALLCSTPKSNGLACGQCESCHWVEQGNHPDFQLVRPEALDEDGDVAESARDSSDSKKKAPSKIIRIEQVRRLIERVGVGSHRGGWRVVVMYPLDMLPVEAANALLKTLEEPPSNTLFLLVTDRIDRLLPTILSRCRQYPVKPPTAEVALNWLKTQGVADAASLLAESGNAPLAAQEAAGADERPQLAALVDQLARADRFEPLAAAEQLQKMPLPLVFSTVQRWLFDLISQRMAGQTRYFPAHGTAAAACASRVDTHALHTMLRSVQERRRHENHPLAPRLVLESLFLEYRRMFVTETAKP
jgi:DNA polymerase-3 subunit delta'